MSYTIKKSDGTTLAVVPENDIVLDAASVALIGRGATNYGAAHSEAFVHILENFANDTPPAYPMEGQLWWDTTIASLKVYHDGNWNNLGAGGSGGGGGGSGDTVGGSVWVQIGDTSVLLFIAGGKIIAALASIDIVNADLPATITFLNQTLEFRSRFPAGLQAGVTLATDIEDYLFKGHVPEADAALWTGGGTPFGATTFCDLGSATVTLTISNDVIVAAFSQIARAQNTLPTNFTINGVTMPFAAAFPSGLRAGLTMADGYGVGIGGGLIDGSNTGVTLSVVAEMITEESEARAQAILDIYAYADENYAQAGIVQTLTAEFLSGTGQSSIAEAVQWIITTAGSGTASADYTLQLKAEITNAITGATSFSQALAIINATVTADYATSQDLTQLQSTITNGYTTAISNATSGLVTTATLNTATSSLNTSLSASINNVQAQLTALSEVVADGSGGVGSAKWSIVTQTGSDANATAFITAQAEVANGVNTTKVEIGAQKFSVYNPSNNTWIKALEVTGGNVQVFGKLQANSVDTTMLNISNGATTGARMTLDPNLLRVYDSNNVMRVRLGVW